MKIGLHIILLLTLLINVFHKTLIIGAFYARKSYIVEYLCENRQKSELKCDGKCFLKKQMQVQQKEQTNTNTAFPIIQETEIVYYYHNYILSLIKPNIVLSIGTFPYHFPQTASPLSDIFRPPSLA